MAYMLLFQKRHGRSVAHPAILIREGMPMSIIKDFLQILRDGRANGDRSLLTFMLGLFVLSLALIAYGLVK